MFIGSFCSILKCFGASLCFPGSDFDLLNFELCYSTNLPQFLGTNLCTPFIHQGRGPQSFGYGEVS